MEERPGGAPRERRDPDEVGEDELLAALRAHRFNIQRTAEELGISRGGVYSRIERSPKIRKAIDLTAEEIQACREGCNGDLDAMVAALEVSKRGLKRRMAQLGLD